MCSKILRPPLPKGYGEEGKNKSRAPAAGGGMDDLLAAIARRRID
jgi:hypothetical protein